MKASPFIVLLTETVRLRVFNSAEMLEGAEHLVSFVKHERRCQVCSVPGSTKRTQFVCEGCEGMPHLHPKSCFKICHTANCVYCKYKWTELEKCSLCDKLCFKKIVHLHF
ncbi:unnamed protein product [Candidula unifasciata]|uniref:Uncharacterized protein n=1 Tax=Candidula unifasciata TaxID=100452 RepID=A0A8S3YNV8_9EUPU|nr:unnamed protein product [Candidula unifasciata]